MRFFSNRAHDTAYPVRDIQKIEWAEGKDKAESLFVVTLRSGERIEIDEAERADIFTSRRRTIPALSGTYLILWRRKNGTEAIRKDPIVAWHVGDDAASPVTLNPSTPYDLTADDTLNAQNAVLMPDGKVVCLMNGMNFEHVEAFAQWAREAETELEQLSAETKAVIATATELIAAAREEN